MQLIKVKKQDNFVFLKQMPNHIECKSGEIPYYKIDETKYLCSCLKCYKPKCIYLDKEEIRVSSLNEISIDENINVCPVNAIKWNNNQIEIDKNICLNCGICAVRCPSGAIYFDKAGRIKINNSINDNLDIVNFSSNLINKHDFMVNDLSKREKKGIYLLESKNIIEKLNNKIYKLDNLVQNLLIRNILIALGCNALISRIGDVYTRLDGIYQSVEGNIGVIEIEFSKDTLGAVRKILDDIAVLHSRYNFDKIKNYSLVVCLQLPNERQGYWQVVKDIKRIEKLKINTITAGALLIMMWNNTVFDLKTTPFYADFDNKSIRKNLEKVLNRSVYINEGELGILEPLK